MSSIDAGSCAKKVAGRRWCPKLSRHRASEKPVEPEIVATPFTQKRNTTEEQKATPKKLAKTSSSGDSLKKAVADANRLKALYFQVQGQVETLKSTVKTDPSRAWSSGDASSDMHTAKAHLAAELADGFGAKILTTDVSNVVASDSSGGFLACSQFVVMRAEVGILTTQLAVKTKNRKKQVCRCHLLRNSEIRRNDFDHF